MLRLIGERRLGLPAREVDIALPALNILRRPLAPVEKAA